MTDFDAVRSAASPRIQALMQRRGELDDQLEFEIEASRGHWSELESSKSEENRCSSDSQVVEKQQVLGRFRRQLSGLLCVRREEQVVEASSLSILARFRRRISRLFLSWQQCGVGCGMGCVVVSCDALNPSPSTHLESVELEEADSSGGDEETNREIFESLRKQWGGAFFSSKWGDTLELGPKIAEGGQAEIFEADTETAIVVKAFKKGYSLRALQLQWPLGMVYTTSATTFAATILKDDRFAFVMHRYWGDLRKLIDLKILQRAGPPFHERDAVAIMLQIAHGMAQLHVKNIPHRDLKAANVLVANPGADGFSCVVADYECSLGVVGTGFWRAPEVLVAVRDGTLTSATFTPEADVYSFGMTSYEILTGWVPFEELAAHQFDAVLKGRRPQLPHPMNSRLAELLCRCWHSNPAERPSFLDIAKVLDVVHRSSHNSPPSPDSENL